MIQLLQRRPRDQAFFAGCVGAAVLLLNAGAQAQTGAAPSTPASGPVVQIIPGAAGAPTPVTFSDADEVGGSDSVVKSEWTPTGLRLTYKIKAYGGVVLRVGELDGSRLVTLRSHITQIEGKPLAALLQFSSANGSRCTFPLEVSPVGGDQPERAVPFGHFTAFNSGVLAETRKISLELPAGSGVLEIESLALVSGTGPVASALPPVPPKSNVALPLGLGAWCYGETPFIVGEVARFNKTAPDDRKIRYLFLNTGTMEVSPEGKPTLHFQPELADDLRKALDAAGEQEALIYPMVDGLTDNLDRMSEADAKEIARTIGTAVEKSPACAGMHFDLEPDDQFSYVIFAAMREFTRKPITAAVAFGDLNLFRYTDLAVLMAYDVAHTPETYATAASKRISNFLAMAEEAHGRAMIGVPAIATHHENSGVSDLFDGPKTATGFQMADFVKGALAPTEAALAAGPHPSFVGYGIWAIHEPGAIHGPSDTRFYFPGHVSPEVWTMLRGRALP